MRRCSPGLSGLGSRTSSVEILADGHMQHSSHRIKIKASVCIAASLRCKRLRGARREGPMAVRSGKL
eukprot:5693045-Pyramimonas_sp.AAC.1